MKGFPIPPFLRKRKAFALLLIVITIAFTAAMAVLSALAAGFGCLFAILREVARIMFRTTAAVAMLTALAPSLRGLLAVLGEIARVAAVLTLCHSFPSLGSKERRTP